MKELHSISNFIRTFEIIDDGIDRYMHVHSNRQTIICERKSIYKYVCIVIKLSVFQIVYFVLFRYLICSQSMKREKIDRQMQRIELDKLKGKSNKNELTLY